MAESKEELETRKEAEKAGLKSLQWVVTVAIKLKTLALWKKTYNKYRQCIKKQRHHFFNQGPYIQHYGFSSNHAWM